MLSDECIADEVPFEIPDNWAWARLGLLIALFLVVVIHFNHYLKGISSWIFLH